MSFQFQAMDEQLADERRDFETRMIDSITQESTRRTPFDWVPTGAVKLFKVGSFHGHWIAEWK